MPTEDSSLSELRPRPGFDQARIRWGRPTERVAAECSYCGAFLRFADNKDDDMPLILSTAEGYLAQFCRDCQSTWFGLEASDDDDD